MRCALPDKDRPTPPTEGETGVSAHIGRFLFFTPKAGSWFCSPPRWRCATLGGSSLPWSGEMATWLFSWSAFCGTVLVYMEKKHIVIDFLVTYIPPRLVKIINYFNQLVIVVVLATLLVTGIRIAMLYSNQSATSVEISQAFVFASLARGLRVDARLDGVWMDQGEAEIMITFLFSTMFALFLLALPVAFTLAAVSLAGIS